MADGSPVVVPVPLDLLRAHANPLMRVYAEMTIRARDGLIACSARDVAKWMEWSSYGTASHYLRQLVAIGALELLYPGSFKPGAVSLDANVYRIKAVDNSSRRDPRRADGAIPIAPSRRDPRRARSTPMGYRGGRTAADGRPHPHPCYCDPCMARLEQLVDNPKQSS